MQPELRFLSVRGLDLAVWEWPGAAPAVLLAHATGFHGRCWDQVARDLEGRRAIAIEFRGHGRSARPDPPYSWADFGRDLAEAARLLDLRGAIGVGHSMGGHSVALCAALRPETFASLLLVDPTIFEAEYYGQARWPDSSFVLKRRNDWASPADMFERFRNRDPFSAWRPEVLRDYCEYGLLPAGDRFALACPPVVEASIYAASNAREANLHPLLDAIVQPVTIVRGGIPWNRDKFVPAASPTAPDLAASFRHGRDVPLAGKSHYIPMEMPEFVAAEIRKLASASSAGA